MRAWLLAFAMALWCGAASAQPLGTVTILEGQALVYRGLGRVHAAEGVRLTAGDIVETAPATFTQVELVDHTVLQLGPATRVMFGAATVRQKAERTVYLLEGWVKLVSKARDAAAGPGFDLRAATFEIPPVATGVAVLHAAPTELRLFVESGELRVAERQRGAPLFVNLRGGDFYLRKPPARGSVGSGVPPAFVATIPRAFRDTLPLRGEQFRERPVTPRDAPAFAYADVEDWLKAEPAVRRPLMYRWRAKAGDSAFRAALVANLSAHPEWDPILFPEKYKPKDPPPPPRPSAEAGARAASAP